MNIKIIGFIGGFCTINEKDIEWKKKKKLLFQISKRGKMADSVKWIILLVTA